MTTLMNMSNMQPQYKLNPDVIYRKIGKEMILINLKTEQIYSLNHTAARFCELLLDGVSLENIEYQLMQEYDVTEKDLHEEINGMIDSLKSKMFLL